MIPRRIQFAIRRQVVRRQRLKHKDVWPIDPAAGKAPPGWAGWPEGKKFALVLTHDVETAEGLANVRPLAELEMKLGFRSSFNFVPGDYIVPRELREFLTGNVFEVGVHGYTHKKGNLFKSDHFFNEQVLGINRFLKEWGAVGFRTPSMYHDLEKMQRLEIQYDSSTFDTDPFEPQPDGVKTIFPFWVSDRNGGRFVELPCTMPQDHTLFIIMKEKDISIWRRKLDWIAAQGGLALLNTHPEYTNLNTDPPAFSEYPVRFYEDFLNYVKTTYEGKYWHVLPRELAQYYKQTLLNQPNQLNEPTRLNGPNQPPTLKLVPCPSVLEAQTLYLDTPAQPTQSTQVTRKALHICMLSYSFYEADARVSRYAETLVRRGDHVDVIAIGREGTESYAIINGVHVYRIQQRERNERGKMTYLLRVLKFLVNSSVFLNKKHRDQPYDLIHVHSVPDFEVFAAWLPKLKGVKIILDIHDIVPEFFAAKFGTGQGSLLYKLLILAEKTSTSFSDRVIISNHIWAKKIQRSVGDDCCSVIINYPDEHIFYKRPRLRDNGKFIMMYPGTLNRHQGLDIALRSLARIKEEASSLELHIYGSGDARESLENLSGELGIDDRVVFHEPRPKEEIASAMSQADLGIVPKRDDSFGGEAFSTKTLEFMSLGIPILVSKTKIDQYYFNDSVVCFFEPENVEDLASKIMELVNNPDRRRSLAVNALDFVKQYKWDNNKHLYLSLVDKLVQK